MEHCVAPERVIIQDAVDFHTRALESLGYPCPLNYDAIARSPETYKCIALMRSTFMFFNLCESVDLPGFDYPVIQHIAVIGSGEDVTAEKVRDCLKTLGREVLVLVESYNKPVLSLLAKLQAQGTYHCQKKLLCRDIGELCVEKEIPEGIVIRHFFSGKDESRYASFYNETLGYLGSFVDESFLRRIVARSTFDPEGYLIAENQGEYAGFLSIEKAPWGKPESGFGYIFQVGVSERWRRNGIATVLLRRAAQFARNHGIDRIGVGARESNSAALRFFQQHGFISQYDVRGYLLRVL